jgi:hypothetical protein
MHSASYSLLSRRRGYAVNVLDEVPDLLHAAANIISLPFKNRYINLS